MDTSEARDGLLANTSEHGSHIYDDLRVYVITHVNQAIDAGWVRPYYQPVIRTLTGKLCGFEALARWDDPERGLLAPAQFVPALEEARLVHLLDCSIIDQVCGHYRQLANEGKVTVPISFNLSRLDFDLCDMFEAVESSAKRHGVPRRMLNIEITETTLGTDPAFMAATMRKFHEAGYQVWMDDFGSGYSTLNVLKDFDFDELKIDMEFLNRFSEKSKTILASVVDMAKKLGIQTLAEGVETLEHSRYLRRIGCEKMQGYLFGAPEPFDPDHATNLRNNMGVETTGERLYYEEIGSVNTLSLSERDLTAGNSTQGYVTSMPLAIVEHYNGQFMILDSNRVFREGLANVGIPDVETAERKINDPRRPLAQHARRLLDTIEREKYARLDYVSGDTACVLRAKHLTSRDGKIALLVSIDNTIEQIERKRHERMDDMLMVMYTIYEHVDVIHLDERFIEPVFGTVGLHAQYDVDDFDSVAEHFAKAEVYPRDRDRYIAFMDHDTMVERIQKSGRNFLSGYFRMRKQGGEFAWKMVGLVYIEDAPGNLVMFCIRGTHSSFEGLLQFAFEEHYDKHTLNGEGPDLEITETSLWRSITRNKSLCVFWKDAERRYVGANKAFLDYYGFDDVDAVVGKTDDDLGWYIDPTTYRRDEQRVLEEGALIVDTPVERIVNGEVRNVVVNKCPVYRDGHIIGIVGFFKDVQDMGSNTDVSVGIPLRDPMTGVLNYTGLEAATWEYVDTYRRKGIDFAMISINVESFENINAEFGNEFGDKVLKRVADELVALAGNNRVIGHVFADRFVVLSQGDDDETLQELCDNIESTLIGIPQVDGTPCTIYALAGFARFSKLGDIDAMKRYNRDRRLERRDENFGGGGVDVITTTLL